MKKTIIIKIGTNVITTAEGLLDIAIMEHLVGQIVALKKTGIQIILVSSGAMGAGRGLLGISPKETVTNSQLLAAVGQVKLMDTYQKLFEKHHMFCAQILATKEDFRDRQHYLNMRNCFTKLLHDDIIPIANENDVVSVQELMFTDNDELAGMIASMMDVYKLLILTSVDGVYDKDPTQKNAKVIHTVDRQTQWKHSKNSLCKCR